MTLPLANFTSAMPQIILLIFGCVALLAGLTHRRLGGFITYILVLISLLVVAGLSALQFGKPTVIAFSGLFVADNFSQLLNTTIALITFAVFIFSRPYVAEHIPKYQTEFYVLGLFSVLGMMVLVSAYNFISLFMGLELFSLPVYAMVAMQRDSSICTEAAMKYFVIGAIASGIFLYGVSIVYGATKSLDIPTIASAITAIPPEKQLILWFGLVFVMVGIAFKFGLVPFHMWVPDVYQGAPTPVTLFITSAPKIAALALAIRVLVDGMPSLLAEWQSLLIVLAILSMAIGNIIAIVQKSLKRMLAYSSIAQIGYVVLGLIAGTGVGYAASTFYVIAYAIMSLVSFGLILLINKAGVEGDNIEDLQGLNSRNPWLAFLMLLAMFSLAGIPPLVGFMAKVAVLEALIEVHMVWLAVIALVFAVIAAYYYINVVKVMYFVKPKIKTPIKAPLDLKIMISIAGLLILILGFFPGLLLNICQMVFVTQI